MSGQATAVFKLSPAQGRELRERLNRDDFQFRSLAHAFFQARGEGVIVSYYKSGKLVVQGKDSDGFQARYLAGAHAAPTKKTKAAPATDAGDVLAQLADSLGSDEAGKGDTFGGLAVAAVGVPADQVEALRATTVADSKSLTDERIRALAPWLRAEFPHAERVLEPAAYHQAWLAQGRNVNKLLAVLHRDCLGELLDAGEVPWKVAVVDRFAAREPVKALIAPAHPGLQVVEVPRAEQHLAVAAASVLARESFLRQMDELRDRFACELPLGSGAPVPPALRRFRELHGDEVLGQAAKLHFKNIQRFLDS
ncbi:MAG: ribonuclease HIII [Planctomycetota bacterium]|jgi:ribonuclease HIII